MTSDKLLVDIIGKRLVSLIICKYWTCWKSAQNQNSYAYLYPVIPNNLIFWSWTELYTHFYVNDIILWTCFKCLSLQRKSLVKILSCIHLIVLCNNSSTTFISICRLIILTWLCWPWKIKDIKPQCKYITYMHVYMYM